MMARSVRLTLGRSPGNLVSSPLELILQVRREQVEDGSGG